MSKTFLLLKIGVSTYNFNAPYFIFIFISVYWKKIDLVIDQMACLLHLLHRAIQRKSALKQTTLLQESTSLSNAAEDWENDSIHTYSCNTPIPVRHKLWQRKRDNHGTKRNERKGLRGWLGTIRCASFPSTFSPPRKLHAILYCQVRQWHWRKSSRITAISLQHIAHAKIQSQTIQ